MPVIDTGNGITQAHSRDEVARFYRLGADPGWRPRYNVAPGQMVVCVRAIAEGREAVLLRWGLVPSWAQDEKALKMKPINARAETASQKPMFRGPFRQRRCIVPVSGWYEWRREGGATASAAKHPYHFRRRDGGLFALAGLWDRFEGPGGALETFAVLTVTASDFARPVHDRMPAILEGEAAEVSRTAPMASYKSVRRLSRASGRVEGRLRESESSPRRWRGKQA